MKTLDMEELPIAKPTASYEARLQRTVTDLQNRVKEQEIALAKLRASSSQVHTSPSADPASQLQLLRLLKATYESLTPREPYLPSADSPLPALLALRTTHQLIQDTKVLLTNAHAKLKISQQRVEQEQSDLDDANQITQSLERRIRTLQNDIEERTQKPPSQVAKDLLNDIKKKNLKFDSETGRLVKAFNSFVEHHLATMLAAEEMGGPVVGELPDVKQTNLESDFNSQGRGKRPKEDADDGKRQRRIDEIWGQRPAGARQSTAPWDERTAAAAEMKELTEQLLNSLVEADGGKDAYVELSRESAAARFLVRSKVAQFHPKDARKLRLIDFGRDLDD